MSDGKECVCFARSASECCCPGVDWTPKEVIDLRQQLLSAQADNKRLRDALDLAKNGLEWYADMHPEHSSSADGEAMEEINEAISTPLDLSALARHEAGALEEAIKICGRNRSRELQFSYRERLTGIGALDDTIKDIRRLAADRLAGKGETK